jgi:APA family basic amino acid/polyamine antiporter
LRWFGEVHPVWETPARATAALAVTAGAYVLASDFQNLLSYFSFSVWIFYALTAVAVLVLRRRGVGDDAAWKAPGGGAAPAVVLATAAAMTSGLLIENTRGSLYGLGMIGAGFAAYAVWSSARRRA